MCIEVRGLTVVNISELRRRRDRLRSDGQDRHGKMGTPDTGVMGHRNSSNAKGLAC